MVDKKLNKTTWIRIAFLYNFKLLENDAITVFPKYLKIFFHYFGINKI